MRTIMALLVLTVFLASCSKTYESATQYPYDEVYNTEGKQRVNSGNQQTIASGNEQQGQGQGDYYEPGYNAQGFRSGGSYDADYASRLNRFGQPNTGFGYYDNYYTGMNRYSSSPYGYGNSMYSGCGCYSPYSWGRMGMSMGYNYGYGYRPSMSYYDPFYNPYGYNPYGYSSYYNGYYSGFYDGYYANAYAPIYNNYYYYGPRGTVGSSSDGTGRGFRDPGDPDPTTGELKSNSKISNGNSGMVSSGNQSGVGNSNGRSTGTTTASNPTALTLGSVVPASRSTGGDEMASSTSRELKPSENQSSSQGFYSKPPATKAQDPVKINRTSSSQKKYSTPDQKYQKPKTYTGPKVRTTPSSKEYRSPSSKSSGKIGKPVYTAIPERKSPSATSSKSRWQNIQQTLSRGLTSPSSSNSGSRSYSSPSSSRSYSSPSSSRSSGSSAGRSSGGSSRSVSSGSSRGGRK